MPRTIQNSGRSARASYQRRREYRFDAIKYAFESYGIKKRVFLYKPAKDCNEFNISRLRFQVRKLRIEERVDECFGVAYGPVQKR